MLLVDTREEPQLVAGAVAAAIAATGSELVRRRRGVPVRLRGRWLARLWRAGVSVPADLARLTVAALRAAWPGAQVPRGRFRALDFEPGRVGDEGDEEADPEDVGRYALAQLAGSFSPNTFVIGVDGERRALLVHQLVPEEKRPRRAIDPLDLG
jgi:hypothetical protein